MSLGLNYIKDHLGHFFEEGKLSLFVDDMLFLIEV